MTTAAARAASARRSTASRRATRSPAQAPLRLRARRPTSVAYAWPVQAHDRARRGRASIDAAPTLAHPGVLAVISHANAPRLAERRTTASWPCSSRRRVAYRGQIVAAVVAETLEAAREAPALVRVEYDGRAARRRAARRPPRPLHAGEGQPGLPRRHRAGRRRTARSPRRRSSVDATYTHARRPQQPDGAARHGRRLGGRRPDALRLQPGRADGARHARARCSGSTPEQRAGDRPARRRRLRLQGHAAAARRARRDRRPGRRAPGQARGDAPADVRLRSATARRRSSACGSAPTPTGG